MHLELFGGEELRSSTPSPYNSSLCLAGFVQVLCGVGGSVDKSIDKKSWTMSAAAMPVISAAAAGNDVSTGETPQKRDKPLSYAGATSTMSAPL